MAPPLTTGIDLTIVVPCLNEQENIEPILAALCNTLSKVSFTYEIVVVDDQSDDLTLEVASKFAEKVRDQTLIRVVRRPLHRRGYGAVVRYGIAHGMGKYCTMVSADGVDPIHHLPEFYERMVAGASLVQCSRYLSPSDAETIPFKYKFYQFFFRLFLRMVMGVAIRDSTYAFKMFNRCEMLAVGMKQNRFSVSPEITLKVLLMGGKVDFVAAGQGIRQRGVSKFKFYKESFGYIYILVRAWLHRTGVAYWF
jgi:glycosyltransferase involved in cell wall biosynthesis